MFLICPLAVLLTLGHIALVLQLEVEPEDSGPSPLFFNLLNP